MRRHAAALVAAISAFSAAAGAAVLGTGGDEIIHSLLDVMYTKAPYTVIRRAMHIHPTVSEYIPTVLGDLHPLTTEITDTAVARAR